MAEIVTRQLVSDIDGKADETVESVRFAWNTENLIIDLTEEQRAEFEEAIAPWVQAARKDRVAGVARSRNTARSTQPKHSREYLQAVRDWAHSEGIEVSDRGRIKGEVMEAYEAAH